MPTTTSGSALRYPASTAVPNVAQDIQNLATDTDAALNKAWTTYTPTWTAATTPPTLGNGTLTGRYRKIGKLVELNIWLSFGSTTNGGAGSYTFSLPSTAAGTGQEQLLTSKVFTKNSWTLAGFGLIVTGGGSTLTPYAPTSPTNGTCAAVQSANAAAAVGSGIPTVPGDFTFGTNSNISIAGRYESAT